MKRSREETTAVGVWSYLVNTVTSIFAPELLAPSLKEGNESHASQVTRAPVFESRKRAMRQSSVSEEAQEAPFSPIVVRAPEIQVARDAVASSGHLPSMLDMLEQEREMERFEQSVHNLSLSRSGVSFSLASSLQTPSSAPPHSRRIASQVPLSPLSPIDQMYLDASEERNKSMSSFVNIADPEERGMALNRLRILTEKYQRDLPTDLMNQHIKWARDQEKAKLDSIRDLNNDELKLYESAMDSSGGENRIVTQNAVMQEFDVELSYSDISRLKSGQWLNDETINLYMKMIQKQSDSKSNDESFKIHCFNSFFYQMLDENGYQKVARWTRRFDLFQKDLVLFPVHLGNHWCLGIINLKKKQLEYYDSLKGDNSRCISLMKHYLESESRDKKKTDFDWSDWSEPVVNGEKLPLQTNGSDCGVFAAFFAAFFARGIYPTFSQSDMPVLRRRMVVELVQGKFLE